MSRTTPPPLQGPSSKERKYDRQLRLWAANGQAALEEAHVLLINSGCGVVGVETLKNLVLPGVGTFTILDAHVVTEEDLGVNFFLTQGSIGRSRAEQCCKLLKELNPDVRGNYITSDIGKKLSQPEFLHEFLTPYTLIIVSSPVDTYFLESIATAALSRSKPLIYVHSVGFYAQFSLQLPPAFPIVETHPDSTSTTDLRLLNPWPELSSLAQATTANLEQLSDHEHGHLPYVFLLLHHLEQWRVAHDGKNPQSYTEKTEFREKVRAGMRMNSTEGAEENYEEAIGAVLKGLQPPALGNSVKEVLNAEECRNLTQKSANFWLIASAIASFHAKHAALPLPGSVPDMKAQSVDYIRLQDVYRAKARKDVGEVLTQVRHLESALGRETRIDEKEVEAFCKEAGFVKLIRGQPLQVADGSRSARWGTTRSRWSRTEVRNPDSLICLSIAFFAYDQVLGAVSAQPDDDTWSFPGADRSTVERDADRMIHTAMEIVRNLWREHGDDFDAEAEEDEDSKAITLRLQKYIRELVRAGGSELHNISALTGGMVAQEAIKVITKQYVPVDNTCVFDGVVSTASVFRL